MGGCPAGPSNAKKLIILARVWGGVGWGAKSAGGGKIHFRRAGWDV